MDGWKHSMGERSTRKDGKLLSIGTGFGPRAADALAHPSACRRCAAQIRHELVIEMVMTVFEQMAQREQKAPTLAAALISDDQRTTAPCKRRRNHVRRTRTLQSPVGTYASKTWQSCASGAFNPPGRSESLHQLRSIRRGIAKLHCDQAEAGNHG